MFKILKYLKDSWVYVLLVVLLLILQANFDLALPSYTSDIVNVGIQQGGIKDVAPEVIREAEMNNLQLFMPNDDIQTVNQAYELLLSQTGSEYEEEYPIIKNVNLYLRKDIDNERLEQLNEIFSIPMLMVSSIKSMDSETSAKMFLQNMPQIPQNSGMTLTDIAKLMGLDVQGQQIDALSLMNYMAQAGMLTKEAVLQMREEMLSKNAGLSDSIIAQMAIVYLGTEYEEIGINLEDLQINYLITTGIKMILISFGMMIISISVGFIASRVAASVGMNLRGKVFKKVVSFSSTEMDKFSTASLITRSTNDIQQIQMVSVIMLRMVVYAPILGIGGVIKVLNSNTSMAWIIGLAVFIILCLITVLVSVAMPKFKKMQTLVDRLNLVTREILTGLSVIRAFSREKYEEKRFEGANKDLTKTMLFTNRVMTFMMPAMMLIMNGITVLIIWVGAKGVDMGNLQVGDMMAFITYTMQIVMSFLMLTMVSIMLPRASVSAGRIDEVLNERLTIVDKEAILDKSIVKGDVTFQNVSFRYPNAKEDVLFDINFTAKHGETTAIIGSTGSGKSTLIHLIPRFYDVTKGRILIDGVDIRDISQYKLRQGIGFVPQKAVLFSGTINSNLKFGNQAATEEFVKKATEIAQAEDFINEKKDKYDSEISQGGNNVSGGQKQRLSIARAIVKDPKIYIFDDSFSALDFKTDVKLRKALKAEVKDSAMIIVAQRISTIMHAEKIIVLDEGRIVGMGTHSELIKNCPVYTQIAKSQLSEKELGEEANING